MTRSSFKSTRESVKENQVYDLLRDRIVDGTWPAGIRIATRRELELQLSVSRVTLQRVLNRLISDGFVVSQGALGTFVSDAPPHLCRYGIVMPHRPLPDRPWAQYLTALAREADRTERSGNLKIPLYHDDEGHTDSEDFQELSRAVRSRRVAGLFFATNPFRLANTPAIDEPGIPRVKVIHSLGAVDPFPQIPTLGFESKAWIDRALDRFLQLGRKRVAVLSTTEWFAVNDAKLQASMNERGLSSPHFWMQGVDRRAPQWAARVVELLMNAVPGKRPDALLIADDNIVEHACIGLVASGIRDPRDLQVIAHSNFPWPTASIFPLQRIGYDIQSLLATGIKLLNRQRIGEKVASITRIPPVFEEEIKTMSAVGFFSPPASVSPRLRPSRNPS